MIFAAGLGTRLYPYTTDRPKALVEVSGKTLLQHAIEKAAKYGYNKLIINVHHFGDQIVDYLERNRNFGMDIKISDERDYLLDTGGAILKAAPYLEGVEPFLVYNVDVISNIDLKLLGAYHEERGGLATMVVRDRKTERYLLLDDSMQLSGWRNLKTGCENISRQVQKYNLLAFSGIQIINPALLKLITETGKFPLIPLYLRLSHEYPIFGYNDPSSLWMDLGKPDQLLEAEKVDFGEL